MTYEVTEVEIANLKLADIRAHQSCVPDDPKHNQNCRERDVLAGFLTPRLLHDRETMLAKIALLEGSLTHRRQQELLAERDAYLRLLKNSGWFSEADIRAALTKGEAP
jgi:hypothetical protein